MLNDMAIHTSGVLNAIDEPILIIDKDYKIIFVNNAALDLCGLSREGVIGKTCHEISHHCPVPCEPRDQCPHQEVFSTGQPSIVTHTHRCREGKERIFNITASPIRDDSGRIVLMIEILRDVTEEEKTSESLNASLQELEKSGNALQKSEALMKNILESVDEGFIIIDPDYKIISANNAYCKQVKWKTENILGKHCYEVSHHRDTPCFQAGEECAPSRTFKTGDPSLAIHTHYDSEDRPVYIETRSYPVKDQSGAVTAVIETLNNITEIRKLEEQLHQSQKMEAIGTLAGGVAHDFNNILTAIIGYGNIVLKNMAKDHPQRVNIEHVLEAADRAAHLTKDLLVFSRKQVADKKAVDLNEIVRKVEKFLVRVIGEDISYTTTLPEGPLPVFADAYQLEQVLMNLATNSLDAMPKGGAFAITTEQVRFDDEFITAHGYGKPGTYAMISVSDTGRGMDEATRQRIFEPFFTTKEVGKGTGLGLAVVYGIIKQHDAYINVYSEPGKGTTFRIYLPLIASGVAEEKKAPEVELSVTGTETILLAEDDEQVRNLTVSVLQEFGYTVITAVDGEDAVKKYLENKDRVQLLLLDLIMPKKSGKEAYDEIRKITPDIKALFASGYAPDIIRQKVLLDDNLPVAYKPISPTDLLTKVRRMLDEGKVEQ